MTALRGVIEGFYGRQWSWESRRNYADYLKQLGLSTYIYAPKGDAVLRQQWRQHWQPETEGRLHALRDHYRRAGLIWGLGLSPFELHLDYSAAERRRLKEKVRRLNELDPDVICILFDDMSGLAPQLAERQLRIIDDVVSESSAGWHIVCPSYYSFDPVLEEVFGTMPDGYLQTLGHYLDASVDCFWTGNQVISGTLTAEDLQAAATLLGRKPILWDNFYANDGRLTADFIPLKPFTGRCEALVFETQGHLLNPMNQAEVSVIPLALLAAHYQNGAAGEPQSLSKAIERFLPHELCELLVEDAADFCQVGRAGFSAVQRQEYIQRYQRIDHPLAQELVEWLSGKYVFDPSCLT